MSFFLIGYYGYGNLGDALCLAKTKALILDVFPESIFCCLGPVTQQSEGQVGRWDFFRLLASVWRAEALVLGGGGVLQTASSQRSFYYYVGVLMVAWMCRKKLWFLAQGIGPVSGWVSRTVLGFLVNQVDFVSVRDRQSKKILLGNDRVQQGADISLYRAPSYKAQALDSGQVGVCFCSEVHADSHVEVMRVLTQMGLGVRGYCFYPEQDLSLFDAAGVCEANKIALTEESFYLESCESLRFMVCMRYHSCVWAALQGVPFLALAYDEKVHSLAAQLNQPCLDLFNGDVDKGRLKEMIVNVNDTRMDLQQGLYTGIAELMSISGVSERDFLCQIQS